MKISTSYPVIVAATVLALVALAGCGSPSGTSDVSPEQRAQQTTVGKSVPPQVQANGQAGQQAQQKNQMDSMREKDAQKSH
jgi:hypothetical protein